MDAIKEGMLASAKAAEAAARIGERLFCQNTPNVMNFNSAICTSRIQSERLIALGLKKETADMFWWDNGYGSCAVISRPAEKEDGEYGKVIPAWSLHRLIELKQPNTIDNAIVVLSREQTYDKLIGMIAKSIKEGCFPKEYLEE